MKLQLALSTLFIFTLGNIIFAVAQSTDQFIQTASMHVARSGHSATLLKDGRVLVAGGSVVWPIACITGSTSAEVYDPATATWTMTTGSLNMDRVGQSAVLLNDGRVWIAGTYEYCSPTEKTEFYDPATGTFSWGPDLPWGMGASDVSTVPLVKLADGSVLIFNGAPHWASDLVWKFDPATNSISEVGHTLISSKVFGRHVQLLKTGEVALLGGGGYDWFLGYILPRYAEIYNPTTNTSRPMAAVPSYAMREGASMTLLNDGRLLIFGGTSLDGQNYMPLATYDPATDTFTQLGDTLYQANGEPKGTVLQDGRVLLTNSGCCGLYYIFSPVDNSVKQIQLDPSTAAGGWRTLTLLNDGHVLVAGGSNGNTQTLSAAAELFVSTPTITLFFTNDVHGKWDQVMEGGKTVLQRIKEVVAAERNSNPDGVAVLDVGDVVVREQTTDDYKRYLLAMRDAGYDAAAVGNHDCCNGNQYKNHKYGSGFNNPVQLQSAVHDAKTAGLHVLSANINALAQHPELGGNSAWVNYEREVEPWTVFTRNGVKLGIFGLTVPQDSGAPYPGSPFSNGLTQDGPYGMTSTARTITEELRSAANPGGKADVVIALGHLGFDGSFYSSTEVGCKQLVEKATDEPNAQGLNIDLVACGHDHALKWWWPDPPITRHFAIEAGSIITCPPKTVITHLGSPECNVTNPIPYYIPYPRLAKVVLSLQNGTASLSSIEWIDLIEPMYLSTYHAQPCDNSNSCTRKQGDEYPVLTLSPGQTVTLTAGFRNLGSRTWYNNGAIDGYAVYLDTVDPWTSKEEPSLHNVELADVCHEIPEATAPPVPPGMVGCFHFAFTIPPDQKQNFTLRVAPVATPSTTGPPYWMTRGDGMMWDVNVKKVKQ